MTKVLVATVKPFAEAAVNQIKSSFEKAGYDCRFFESYKSQDDLKKAVADAEALIIRSDKITEEIMDAAPKLKIVVRAGAGFDNVDLAAATVRDIVVMNTPGQNSNAVAELVLGMLVFQARNHFNGKPGTELKGKKLGIQAYGHVGRNVARIAKGFGMEVFAFDPFVDKSRIEADGVVVFDNLEEMYKACDYISLHIPANAHTIKSINYDLLSKMKPGATLVNTARKEIIHEDDLLKILHERDNFSYISDISPDNRETIENEFGDRCFFTPKKMGAQTAEANINAGTAAANQVIAFLEKGDTTFQVN